MNKITPPYILIGISGAGKSTVGYRLAQRLGYEFWDTDRLLEAKEGRSIQELLQAADSLEAYLTKEKAVVAEVLERLAAEKERRVVLATGGSVCYFPAVFSNAAGTIIHLKISYRALRARIKDFSTRAFVMKQASLKKEYAFRAPRYRQLADLEVNSEGWSLDGVVEKVYNLLS